MDPKDTHDCNKKTLPDECLLLLLTSQQMDQPTTGNHGSKQPKYDDGALWFSINELEQTSHVPFESLAADLVVVQGIQAHQRDIVEQ